MSMFIANRHIHTMQNSNDPFTVILLTVEVSFIVKFLYDANMKASNSVVGVHVSY